MKKINHCLKDAITEYALYLGKIQDKILTILPIELQAHCQLGSLEYGILTLIVPTGAIATNLRFLVPTLLKQLNRLNDLETIQEIKIMVRQDSVIEAPGYTRHSAPLTQDNATLIRETAETIQNADLREALLNLTKNSV